MAALTVEHLKVMAALTVEHANASSDGGDGGLNSRARKSMFLFDNVGKSIEMIE